ncbi:MAG TPA: DUF4256 domain-containing protein [Bacteroidales bacterium]|nr:DUF4256 domain-containing protein [Bacteroidales bacterium]
METTSAKRQLTSEQQTKLITILKTRFEKNRNRHKNIQWDKVLQKIESKPEKLWSLYKMENTGGEPDIIGYIEQTGEYVFVDCSPETPADRRNVCYDDQALELRKEHKPKNSALGMAAEMGVEILTEDQYRELQKLGDFDTKTSSWIWTPPEIRKLGGALFCDRRYDHVFVYHNGAESYYGARGFRTVLKL